MSKSALKHLKKFVGYAIHTPTKKEFHRMSFFLEQCGVEGLETKCWDELKSKTCVDFTDDFIVSDSSLVSKSESFSTMNWYIESGYAIVSVDRFIDMLNKSITR